MATAQANPGATFDKLRELINQERRTVGDSERIPPLFPPQSSAKRLPATAWANAPKMKPSTGPISPTLQAMVQGKKVPGTGGASAAPRQASVAAAQQSSTEPPPPVEKVKSILWEQPLWFYGVLIALVVMIGVFGLLLMFSK